jgi:peroxiredoxin
VELPHVEDLWKKYGDRGLSVVGIQTRKDPERAAAVIKECGMTFPLLENEEDNDVVYGKFGVDGVPTSYIIDGEGRIMYYHIGFQKGDEKELEREIRKLLDI